MNDPEVRTLGEYVRENLGKVSVYAGLFAGLTYVVVRLAVGTFYSGFGLSPEEVGIDQTAIVARSGGVALLSLIILSLLALLIALLGDLPRMHRERNDKIARSEIVLLALMLGGALAFAFVRPLGIVLFGAAVLMMLVGGSVRGAVSIWQTPMTAWRPRVAIASLLVVTATVLGVLFGTATDSRGDVLAGKGLSQAWVGMPWQATVVTVSWIGAEKAPIEVTELQGCAMHLGTADGTVILVNPDSDRVVRIPADNVVLQAFIGPGEWACIPAGPKKQAT